MINKLLAGLLFLMTIVAIVGWYFVFNPALLHGAGGASGTAEEQGPEGQIRMNPLSEEGVNSTTPAAAEDELLAQTRAVLVKVGQMACGDRPSDPDYCACLREETITYTGRPEFKARLKAEGPFDHRKIMITMNDVRNICVAKAGRR